MKSYTTIIASLVIAIVIRMVRPVSALALRSIAREMAKALHGWRNMNLKAAWLE